MIFGKLLPREGNFFELFNQHATHTVAAAHAFANLVKHYNDPLLREKYTQEVDAAENSADDVTREVNKLLHKTFITPLDREQIHSLINTMDDVADLIHGAAETMALYDVRTMTDEIIRLTELGVKCCERLRSAVGLLHDIGIPDRGGEQLGADIPRPAVVVADQSIALARHRHLFRRAVVIRFRNQRQQGAVLPDFFDMLAEAAE